MLYLALICTLLASGMKIEEVIAHENMQQQLDLTIDENLHGGKVIVLSDGSTWEVAPQDLNTSQSWILPTPLKVEKSNNPSYPYKITTIATGTSILVRPIKNYSSSSSAQSN